MISRADVEARIKQMRLRWFALRRSKKQYSAFGNIYEFRSEHGRNWYPVHRSNIMFPKLDPKVAEFVRKLFTWLDQGNEVEVQGEYSEWRLKGKLLILPDEELQDSGSRHSNTPIRHMIVAGSFTFPASPAVSGSSSSPGGKP